MLNYGKEELEAVQEVLNSKWISMGGKVASFEDDFASLLKVRNAVAVTNCTAALHLALRLSEVGPGDEVIIPSMTFVATANAVKFVGAKPVFADVTDLNDWTISPDEILNKITSRTKAIIPVHYAGFGADMESIMKIAEQKGLSVIEDASHAPGAVYKNKNLGSIGHFGCFSFYSNKNISTAEGGMLVTNDEKLAEKCRHLRSHGMSATAYEREGSTSYYDMINYGYNYRMDDIRAALGIVQLKKLKDDIKKRNMLADVYKSELSGVKSIAVPFQNYNGSSSYYIFPIMVENGNRDSLRKQLFSDGIQTSIHYKPVHEFTYYSKSENHLPFTSEIGSKEISLPLHFNLSEQEVVLVCESLKKILQ